MQLRKPTVDAPVRLVTERQHRECKQCRQYKRCGCSATGTSGIQSLYVTFTHHRWAAGLPLRLQPWRPRHRLSRLRLCAHSSTEVPQASNGQIITKRFSFAEVVFNKGLRRVRRAAEPDGHDPRTVDNFTSDGAIFRGGWYIQCFQLSHTLLEFSDLAPVLATLLHLCVHSAHTCSDFGLSLAGWASLELE